MKNELVTAVVTIDLNVAFNMVNHNIFTRNVRKAIWIHWRCDKMVL